MVHIPYLDDEVQAIADSEHGNFLLFAVLEKSGRDLRSSRNVHRIWAARQYYCSGLSFFDPVLH